jgi:hypothetical protein
MSENNIFIAAGSGLNCNENSWQHFCKHKLNCNLYDLTEEKIGNTLISRKLIYKVNELIKTHQTDDIIVGIMWTIPEIHERYITVGKKDEYVTSVVENVKNWIILSPELISSSEDNKNYFKIIQNKLQSYVLTFENILRTQWFLNRLGIKYFMTSHLDIFDNEENYLKMYNFSKLKEFKKTDYHPNILNNNEVNYLDNMIDKKKFLPINSMLDWVQENYPIDGFYNSDKLKPSNFANERFVEEVIIPFLKNTYNI